MPDTRSGLFLNGVPELLILECLRGGEMYGYELVQAIRARTGEDIVLGEGVIYPLLHALEKEGALSSRRQAVNGRSRIYYALTDRGASRLVELTELWRRITAAISGLLAEPRHA